MREITVVGGGLAGLVAAIDCAAAGVPVRLVEAGSELGGRARTSNGAFRANLGPHALYADGYAWSWLTRNGLLPRLGRVPLTGFRLRHRGRLHRLPPAGFARALARRCLRAPVDLDFRTWAARRWDDEVAAMLCGAAGVFCFDSDPGRWSAAFVWPRLLRVARLPPAARYPVGGWSSLVARLAERAQALGVMVERNTRVASLPAPPVILATELPTAATLLDDGALRWDSGHALCLDVGLEHHRGDPFVVWDLDGGGWVERFTASDPTLAPDGAELVQAQIGIRPDETPDAAAERLERLLDVSLIGWRERELWRRRQIMDARTGALDRPGTTWRDRPPIEAADGVFLAGDMVAAEGLLAEVSFASADEAAVRAVSWIRAMRELAPERRGSSARVVPEQ